MAYCTTCGSPIGAGINFCGSCGQAVLGETLSETTSNAARFCDIPSAIRLLARADLATTTTDDGYEFPGLRDWDGSIDWYRVIQCLRHLCRKTPHLLPAIPVPDESDSDFQRFVQNMEPALRGELASAALRLQGAPRFTGQTFLTGFLRELERAGLCGVVWGLQYGAGEFMVWDYLADRRHEVPAGRNGVLVGGREVLLDAYVEGGVARLLLEGDDQTEEEDLGQELVALLGQVGLAGTVSSQEVAVWDLDWWTAFPEDRP